MGGQGAGYGWVVGVCHYRYRADGCCGADEGYVGGFDGFDQDQACSEGRQRSYGVAGDSGWDGGSEAVVELDAADGSLEVLRVPEEASDRLLSSG